MKENKGTPIQILEYVTNRDQEQKKEYANVLRNKQLQECQTIIRQTRTINKWKRKAKDLRSKKALLLRNIKLNEEIKGSHWKFHLSL